MAPIGMIMLCSFCAQAHPGFESGECYLCKGQLLRLDEWVGKAEELLEKRPTFSLSTQIPREWLAREEELWDKRAGGETIKQTLNQTIVNALARNGRRYWADAPYRLRFDFFHGIVEVLGEPIFFFGRYQKWQANLSQTRWLCSTCRGKGCGECKSQGKHYDSIEECIGEPFKTMARAENYFLHASGREDVDATNTAGRPFVLEVTNPEEGEPAVADAERIINEGGRVKVEGMRRVSRRWVALVSDSHFDKEYEAEIEFVPAIEPGRLQELAQTAPFQLHQQTPHRVAHRRADKIRPRWIRKMEVVQADPNRARLRITAEAGTYIKEFVSGDEGRTRPSVSERLGVSAKVARLEVTKIYDEFLELGNPQRK